MKRLRLRLDPWAARIAAAVILLAIPIASFAEIKFAVSFPAERSKTLVDGRMLLLLSTNGDAEPRFQISDGPSTQLVFGVDVEGLAPGTETIFDASAFGYPVRSLAELPAGEYYVQALLHRYETFRRSDGHVVKLPMDRGEGQRWNAAPGNLYSAPRK
ncbi:MAG: hypothetical protein IH583_01485, partial [Candidatus Aminicenantes bacterium]|nr:hypothetical protein [Candidatus Aminicenantes bacterium]